MPATTPPNVDFANFTYTTLPCSANVPPPAKVVNGQYTYNDPKEATQFDVHVSRVVRGSMNAGTQQAVVVIACDYPIGGTSEAYAYDIRSGKAVLLGSVGGADWGGDWGLGPSSIHVRFANGFLYVDTCNGSDCATREVRTYALRGGKLVKVWVQTHKSSP